MTMCCHKTRLRDAPCPIGRQCPYDQPASQSGATTTLSPEVYALFSDKTSEQLVEDAIDAGRAMARYNRNEIELTSALKLIVEKGAPEQFERIARDALASVGSRVADIDFHDVELRCAAAFLTAAGWKCVPPGGTAGKVGLPLPLVGQVWRSPRPMTEDRTITHIGPHLFRPHVKLVRFTTPRRGDTSNNYFSFLAWAKKTGARPI